MASRNLLFCLCISCLLWCVPAVYCRTQAPPHVPPQQPPAAGNGSSNLQLPRAMDAAPLRELLYNRNRPQEQSQAAFSLVQSDSAEVVALVVFEMTRWDRPDVFQSLASAIKLRRDIRYLQPLLDALAAEQAAIRLAAIDALAALPAKTVQEALVKAASDKSLLPLSRQAAVEALGRLATKSAVTSLIELLTCDSANVRQAAVLALQEISGNDFGSDLFQWKRWWKLYEPLSEEDWQATRLRFFADRARRLRDELDQAESTLLQLHKELLDKVLQADMATTLMNLSSNTYPAVRELAVTKISEQFSRKDLDAPSKRIYTDTLLHLSKDAHAKVQQRAVQALERADSPEVYRRLIDLLRAPSAKVRAAAARSLGNYRGSIPLPSTQESTLAALEQALRDSSPNVVAQAATSIGALRLPRSSQLLAELLKHPTEEVRLAACASLETIAHCEVYHAVLAGLDDVSPEARLYLVGCLAVIGENDGLPEKEQSQLLRKLEQVLTRDGDPGVRSKAAAALGKVGTPAFLNVLWQRVAGNEDSRVQENAWKAFVDILHRQQSWPMLNQWERFLATQGQAVKRWQLLQDIRQRWLRLEETRSSMDLLTYALIDAGLAARQWQAVIPICLDLVRSAQQDTLREERLRFLLVAGQQAVAEGKGMEFLPVLKDIELYLPAFKELANSFDDLRRRIHSASISK